MKNVLKGTNSKISLIGKINGLASQTKKTRRLIKKSKSPERNWKYTYTKYIVGLDTRHHLLAYAFLRGALYHNLERTCRPEHLPNAASILTIVQAHDPRYRVVNGQYTIEDVKAWLDGREL
jgi:hypothetical protein